MFGIFSSHVDYLVVSAFFICRLLTAAPVNAAVLLAVRRPQPYLGPHEHLPDYPDAHGAYRGSWPVRILCGKHLAGGSIGLRQ